MTVTSKLMLCVALAIPTVFQRGWCGDIGSGGGYEFVSFGVPSTFNTPPRLSIEFDFYKMTARVFDYSVDLEYCDTVRVIGCISFDNSVISIPESGVTKWAIGELKFESYSDEVVVLGRSLQANRVSVKNGNGFELMQYYYSEENGIFLIVLRMDNSPFIAQAFISTGRSGIPLQLLKQKK